ncbi:hypothetical protein ymoll0001_17700 [Yersinia mollaretii ATCC 43969]|uniref:Peptidase C14 caspase domain-containing protein n=1 Tax=Yersinia mollaretii (strain ATCC 43969 / DSM 18520 / CIP 103324 / CNY 7263 / WAIP 204) TaxID=349967 RepID=A0ABP2EDX2_YERMW|nr:caspase family protein [Yersinia mollaretii]EEQ09911.1 hypothetical protein ymoll0001_17700 [Yersinia mollaretii ATCC 43969]QKJ04028.1 caspase family protein [Yersinia mollaretii ATCC 43969]
MNLAIIIGVSEYNNETNLPACLNDANIVNEIVSYSKKYNEILFINKQTTSASVKNQISEFIRRHEGIAVDEFFFYFSGHGLYDGNEFHYAMTDCDIKKLKQTTLENSEIDLQIKSLSPELTVKVVDSCQAGVSYIKNLDSFNKYLDDKAKGFNRCYFMLSSQSHQSSFADIHLSLFTKSFIEAITNIKVDDVRYKDIIDFISDDFTQNQRQTPLFVSQANFTEIFLTVESDYKILLANQLKDIASVQSNKVTNLNLLERIKIDAERYLSQEEAMAVMNSIKQCLFNKKFFDYDGKDIYTLEASEVDNYKRIPNIDSIASWASKNERSFFVKALYEKTTRKIKVPKSKRLGSLFFAATIGAGNAESDYDIIEETVNLPVSIDSTVDIPFIALSLKAKSEYENINSSILYILPIISRTAIIIFSFQCHYKKINWSDEREIYESQKWSSSTFELIKKLDILDYVNKLLIEFENFSLEPIKNELGIIDEERTDTPPSQ